MNAAARRPGPAARVWLLVALGAGLLSLGLPWNRTYTVGDGTLMPGYLGPGLCHVAYDWEGWAYTECDSFNIPYIYQPGLVSGVNVHGFAHPARVMLLLAALAVLVGYRRGSRALLLAAPALAALGLVAFGFTGRSGQLVCVAAVVALLVALHKDGVLRHSAGRPSSQRNSPRRKEADASNSL